MFMRQTLRIDNDKMSTCFQSQQPNLFVLLLLLSFSLVVRAFELVILSPCLEQWKAFFDLHSEDLPIQEGARAFSQVEKSLAGAIG